MMDIEILETPTPSQEIIKKANQAFAVTDGIGRTLTLKKPPFSALHKLLKVVGDDTSAVRALAIPLMYLAAIDGDPVFLPKTENELLFLYDRLDRDGAEGYTALSNGITENFTPATAEKQQEDLKNS